ncbi:MAG: hypothetical protein LLG06_11600 [Desulfobacteraceae bacterium]|nr:hypothetical protein [Desulfobacteraceae bacterium]
MSKRLDEVFSVEKLRRSWKGEAQDRAPEAGEGAEPVPEGTNPTAEASFQKLVATIERCFSPECLAAMTPLLGELEELLKERFPADSSAPLAQADRFKLTMALDGLLNRIEDLLEAFEAGSGR